MDRSASFSARLREAIHKAGVKQKALAHAVGVSANSLSRYLMENRKPSRAVLYALSKELHVTPEYLLGDSNEPIADSPVALDGPQSYIPDAVALTGLGEEDRRAVVRLLNALRSGDVEIRRHLIGQLKIIESAMEARRKQSREAESDAS